MYLRPFQWFYQGGESLFLIGASDSIPGSILMEYICSLKRVFIKNYLTNIILVTVMINMLQDN